MSPVQYKLDIPTLHHKFSRNYTPFRKDRTIIAFYNNWIIFSPSLLYIQGRKEDKKKQPTTTWNPVTMNYQQQLVFLKRLANTELSQWMSHLADKIRLIVQRTQLGRCHDCINLNWISVSANSRMALETNKPTQWTQQASSPEKSISTVDGVRLAQDRNQRLGR